jgi:hypothetical protein
MSCALERAPDFDRIFIALCRAEVRKSNTIAGRYMYIDGLPDLPKTRSGAPWK